MDHTWMCHHCKPFEIREEQTNTVYSYDDEWLVCQACDLLISTNNRKALAVRSAESHPDREPGNLRALYSLAEFVHNEFFHGWLDSHPLYERRACLVKLPNVQ